MSEASGDWASSLSLSAETATAFEQLVTSIGLTPEEVLRLVVESVLAEEQRRQAYGLPDADYWASHTRRLESIVRDGMRAMPLDIRQSGFMWPPHKRFPWTAEECRAAVLGYCVKWTGDFHDFAEHLPGQWEMIDGFAVLWQR